MPVTPPPLTIKTKKLKQISNDPVAAAKAVKLTYVNCSDEGITRIKNGKDFIFKYKNNYIFNHILTTYCKNNAKFYIINFQVVLYEL